MLQNIPNIISIFTIFLVIPIIYLIWKNNWEAAFLLVLLAGVSDGLDGFLARSFHWESELGATLDPMADKILLIAIFIVLGLKGIIPQWFVVLVVVRDAIIIAGLLLYTLMTDEMKIKTLLISKLNTALLIIFVLLHLSNLAIFSFPGLIFNILIVMIVITTIVSGTLYVILWINHFIKYREDKV